MTRIPLHDPQSASGTTKDIFDGLQKALGTVPNMTKAMVNSPAVLQAYAQFNGAMSRAKLSPQIREQIALLMAQRNECSYCVAAHTAIGALVGLKPDQVASARRGASGDARTQAALTFAQRVLDTKGGVSESDLLAARTAGLTDGELAEVVASVALDVFTNYFNRAFATEVDFPRVELRESAGAVRSARE